MLAHAGNVQRMVRERQLCVGVRPCKARRGCRRSIARIKDRDARARARQAIRDRASDDACTDDDNLTHRAAAFPKSRPTPITRSTMMTKAIDRTIITVETDVIRGS